MKIDFRRIVKDHFLTLKDGNNTRPSFIDLFVFFVVPLIFASLTSWLNPPLSKELYNISITFFGIFIALLLNIQVAIFGIFQRNWAKPEDERLAIMQEQKLSWKRRLLKEINSNISYLVLFCCLGLFLFVGLYIFEATSRIFSFIIILVYMHFLLTLLMVVKRSHSLFQAEYS